MRDVGRLVKGSGRSTYRTLRYFDTDRGEFRSFRIENFITTY
ncbi:MAG: SH3 beta-barrel fold-containing protein [Parabacteroides sp.]|nr:SH3 beta-barrel fold-containing protein [Parabacteroides sp.]